MSSPIKESFLEEQLVQRFSIGEEKLHQARKLSQKNHLGLLFNLQQMGVLTETQMVDIQLECFGLRILPLKNYPLKEEIVHTLPEELKNKYQLLPVSISGNLLTVATPSIVSGQAALTEIQKHTTLFVNFVLAYPAEIRLRLAEFNVPTEEIDTILENRAEELTKVLELGQDKLIENTEGPIAHVITHLIHSAVTGGASDIHFEPLSSAYRVRFRQDGVLREIKSFDKVFSSPFAAATKIMSGMDIAETRMPQDGTFRMNITGRTVDFRVATYPTEQGEKIVIRILDSNRGGISIDNLLLPVKEKEKLIHMIEKPYGLIACAGPTGSGKSTTLYAILAHLNSNEVNILTIEDPIEYRLTGINQAQVNTKKGFTFASGLRAMLRLDPNVILVGEMRDLETASIGVQAALTGHLVLSTVHANSATQTVSRFLDLGVEPFTVAAALQGVISQRLVRRICEHCKEEYTPTKDERSRVGLPSLVPHLYRSAGCQACHKTGYKGRLPIIELLVIHDEIRPLIKEGIDPNDIFVEARKHGMMTIRENALDKLCAGLTSTQEILRILGAENVADSAPNVVLKAA